MPKAPLLKIQKASLVDRVFKDPIWVSKVEIPKPLEKTSLPADVLWDVIQAEKEGGETIDKPIYATKLNGEWAGFRAGVKDPHQKQPNHFPGQLFEALKHDQQTLATVFYLLGNAYFQSTCWSDENARLLNSICQSPHFTLPFCVLDALVAYFYLLSPPPGCFHEPSAASSIILAGESAGAGLHLALLQILLHVQRTASRHEISATLHITGRVVPIDMPGGCAFVSPLADLAFSLHSATDPNTTDWLYGGDPWVKANQPAESIWPSNPPRSEKHCDDSVLSHPIFCPSTCRDWSGAPPVWIACGDETHSDGMKMLVRRMHGTGVKVTLQVYKGMPHVWPVVLPKLPQASHCIQSWAGTCLEMICGSHPLGEACVVRMGDMARHEISIESLLKLSLEQALEIMKEARVQRMGFVWTGPNHTAML